MKTPDLTCERCGAPLNEGRAVWLEMSTKTGKYTDPVKHPLPEDESQGCFPFGKDCAVHQLGDEGDGPYAKPPKDQEN